MSDVQNVSSIPELKARAVAERKAARARDKSHRQCFWTWPWGHVWKYDRGPVAPLMHWKCAACGKTKVF